MAKYNLKFVHSPTYYQLNAFNGSTCSHSLCDTFAIKHFTFHLRNHQYRGKKSAQNNKKETGI